MNSFYKRKPKNKWTWESPNGLVRNEIDFITTNKPKLFLNVEVLNRFNYNTDHWLLRGHLRMLEPKKSRKNIQNKKVPIWLPLPNNVLEPLKTKLTSLDELQTVQDKYDIIEEELKETNKQLLKDKTVRDKIGPKAKDLLKQRALLFKDKKNNKQEITKLSKEINTKKIRARRGTRVGRPRM